MAERTAISGGVKISQYIGQWVIDNCLGIRIKEEFPTKDIWDADALAYETVKNELLLSMRTDVEKAHDLFESIKENLSDCILILSVKNDMSVMWNSEFEDDLRELGLKQNFENHNQQSYIAVIDRGTNIFEKFSTKSLIYQTAFCDTEVHTLRVESENYKQGDSSRIYIDDIDYSMNIPGLNIAVYDCNRERVIKKAAINFTVNPIKCYEEETDKN